MDSRIFATIPMFHAFSGCDTVSAFCGRGKKTAWITWEEFPLMQTDMAMETICGAAL